MKRIFAAFAMMASLNTLPAHAQDPSVLTLWDADRTVIFDAAVIDPDELVWQARALVVFGQSPEDPQFVRQLELLADRMDELAERDVIVIADSDPENPSPFRLALRPRGFMLALLAKDGRVAFRKPAPWDVREISRSIDKMPLRQQEISDRRLGN